MIDAMRYWITEFDIDGFRADLAHLTPLPFWVKARLQLSPCKKDLIWLAETEEVNYHEAFDISYTWKWMHISEQLAKGEKTLTDCIQVLSEYKRDFEQKDLRLFFTSNHDENSWNGSEYDKYGIFAKALAVFSFLYAAVPLIYSGQEIPNFKKLEFFDKDNLIWTEEIKLHQFYKTLLTLRQRKKVFQQLQAEDVKIDESLISENILLMTLEKEEEVVFCIINFNKIIYDKNLQINVPQGQYKNIFSGQETFVRQYFSFELEAGGFCILEKILQ